MTAGNAAISWRGGMSFARSLEPVAFAGSPDADSVYLQARMEPQAACIQVILGATPEGKEELVGFHLGVRESAQIWRELLVDIEARSLAVPPEIAVGDGAMGFWKALEEVFPGTRHQRCWRDQDLIQWIKSPDNGAKYAKAVSCLARDRDALLTFYGSATVLASIDPPDRLSPSANRRELPADRWDHLRTGNPIESVFATIRHRTGRTKGALSQKTAKLMVFKLVPAAAKTWHRLKGANQLPLVTRGVTRHRRRRRKRQRNPRRVIRPRHPDSSIAQAAMA